VVLSAGIYVFLGLLFDYAALRYYGFSMLLIILLCGCIGDYFSLWKTRFLLVKIASFKSAGSAFGLVIGDIGLTILIYLASVISVGVVGSLFFLLIGQNDLAGIFAILPVGAVVEFAYGNIHRGEVVPIWELLPAALLTSAWLWVYLVVAYGLRGMNRASPIFRFLTQIFDLQDHPVRSIGYVAAALSAVGTVVWSLV
jgi:hypothetical protein